MRALLDVNVLLALFDADHAEHRRARAWLASEIHHGWASCPITQNGFVRIISQPKYPSPIAVSEAAARLERATETAHHAFWPCDLSVLDAGSVDRSRVHGPRQVTDAYLLALAVHHGGRFATFDGRIPLKAVSEATPEHLVVV
jgi:toxin-antitoxin system PIN domain toxin